MSLRDLQSAAHTTMGVRCELQLGRQLQLGMSNLMYGQICGVSEDERPARFEVSDLIHAAL